MARPLRIEYEGALYHLTGRGNRREAVFADEEDLRTVPVTFGRIAAALSGRAPCLRFDG
jgi:hypothetical protein